MKISRYDKLQAFKRSKIYRKDFLQYTKDREKEGLDDLFVSWEKTGESACILSESGKWLCEKWQIGFPVDPDTEYVEGEEDCVHVPVTYLELPDQRGKWKKTIFKSSKGGRHESITHINGKLVLMIDTSYSTDQIKAAMKKILYYWTRKTTNRSKPSRAVDIWQVYDEVEGGKKQYQVAQEYAANQTDPGLPVKLTETHVKLIQDSYKKACEIICAVEKGNQTVAPIDPMKFKVIKPTKNK
jgi:hypothetical protein